MKIEKEKWQQCYICNASLRDIKKEFGGSNKYDYQAMKSHIENHNTSVEEYFEKITDRPLCECNVCNQKSRICTKQNGKSGFFWKKYICGRNEGVVKWSSEAKITRCGTGNPMFNQKPWNLGLNAENNESLKRVSDKLKNKIITDVTKDKQAVSAKKRKVHGHSGILHTEESKHKMRLATLKRIKNGDFKQTRTKPHIELGNILNIMGLSYEEEKIIEKWAFDFYIPEYNLYIEVDGDYFHSNPKIYPNGPITKTQKINWYRDIKKNKYVIENNIKLLRLWESDILSNSIEIEKRIQQYEI